MELAGRFVYVRIVLPEFSGGTLELEKLITQLAQAAPLHHAR